MNNITEEELFALALEENEDAKNALYEKYKFIIDVIISKYNKIAYKLGVDHKELYSEGLLGFSDALINYREDKDTSLATFITVCVDRRVRKQIDKASRPKNKMNAESYSLDYVYDEFGIPLLDIISDEEKFDPLNNMALEESYQELLKNIKQDLSDSEYMVFTFLADGFDYNQIANIMGKSPKQIDNTIQRMKIKLKKILEKRKNT